MFGSHSAMTGKIMIKAIATASHKRKGNAARYISPIVVSGGATLFITKRLSPKGGVVVPISMLRRNNTANHTGENPKVIMMGTNIGMVIIMIGTADINIPRKSNII